MDASKLATGGREAAAIDAEVGRPAPAPVKPILSGAAAMFAPALRQVYSEEACAACTFVAEELVNVVTPG